MKKYQLFILILFFFFAQKSVTAQDTHEHRNEISLAAGAVSLVNENETALGLHLHYIKGIGHKNRFGIGLGLEAIFDEHRHYTASTVFQYRVYKNLILNYAPGILMRKENDKFETQFAQHFESSYEFEIGDFHIGPVVELGIEPLGVHFMGGLHFGFGF